MSIIDEIIRVEENGLISFGDYLSPEKKKRVDFEVDGNLYNVKTCQEITRLEKNGKLLLETVPGAVVHELNVADSKVEFLLEGLEDTRITMELEPEALYRILIEGTNIGNVKSNISGKVIFSLELDDQARPIEIIKI